MSEKLRRTNPQETKGKKKWYERRSVQATGLGLGGLAVVATAMFGGNKEVSGTPRAVDVEDTSITVETPATTLAPPPSEQPAPVTETEVPVTKSPAQELEHVAESYQQGALDFAKVAVEKFSSEAIATPLDTGESDGSYRVFQITTPPNQVGDSSYTLVAMLDLQPNHSSIEIMGTQESTVGSKPLENRVSTVIAIDTDNPLLTTDSDAPISSKDFVLALKGAEADDVQSIVVIGEDTQGKVISGNFSEEEPHFTSDEEEIPYDAIPSGHILRTGGNKILANTGW